MAATMKDLGLDKLSDKERMALADELWASVEGEVNVDLPLTDAQRAELGRKISEYEANPNDVVSWEQVRDEALARMRK